ncbi:MAG: hypothetical protein A2Y77_06865 [Planctomycetes bacterium RBG_13_62_9]|nr:MAG: hypothetical protein A2Y77_06865 [Planctomycetes bacterium RBG_13_62_9]
MKETNVGDFRTRKVFVVESKTVFWGAGTALSPTGHEFLDTLAAYAGTVPDRMVITESGPGDNPELGLLRAIVTVNYLTTQGIAKERCSVAAEGTLPAQSSGKERTLEIALLDESVYK